MLRKTKHRVLKPLADAVSSLEPFQMHSVQMAEFSRDSLTEILRSIC